MRILIVKLSAIGDLVHALPAVAAIRENLPDAEITWVVEQRSAEIIRGCTAIDHIIEIDTRSTRGGKVIAEILPEMTRQTRAVRERKYDLAIDMQGLIKSAVIAKISRAKRRWGFSRAGLRESASRLLLSDTVKIPHHIHVIHKNMHLAAAASGFKFDGTGLKFPIATNDEHLAEAAAIIERSGPRFAILNPGGGWVTKLWPAEKFGRLADRIYDETGMTTVVATGPNETDLAGVIAETIRTAKMILTQPGLKGFYELAKRSAVYIGGDTGPTHIAIAARAPVVGLFGPTEWWRNGSLAPDDICVERTDIACRTDCHRRTCSNWICMDSDVETVSAAVAERLRRAAAVEIYDPVGS